MDEAQYREIKQMLKALLGRLVIIAAVAFGVLDYAVLVPLIRDTTAATVAEVYSVKDIQCSDL